MKKFVILFVFAFAYVHAEGESSSSEEDLNSLATFFQNKFNSTLITDLIAFSGKTKEKCPDIEQKMDSVHEEVSTCMENIELGDQTFCSLIRNNLVRCSEPVTKLLEGCVPQESKGLPVMAVKIVKSIIDQACNSTVEEIVELLNPCVRSKAFNAFDSCTQIKDVLEQYKNKVPSKSLVCSTFPKIKSCLTSHREASCKNPVTKAAGIHFFQAVDDVTETECQSTNEAK